MTYEGKWSPGKVHKRSLSNDWAPRFTVSAPPSVPVTPTPNGKYYTFTSSTTFTIGGLEPLPVSLVVVGGGNGGYSAVAVGGIPTPKGTGSPSTSPGDGGSAGVVNYQSSTTLAPGTYTITVGAVSNTSGIYNSGPGSAVFTAAGAPGNPFISPAPPGTLGNGTGGGGSTMNPGDRPGGNGTVTPWGTYAGGGGAGAFIAPAGTPSPPGTGGTGGGGAGGIGTGGNATSYGSGGGGGGSDGTTAYAGGSATAGLVIIQVPLKVV